MGSLVGLEAGIGEDDDESLAVFVAIGNWDVLFGDELGEGGGRKRLSA